MDVPILGAVSEQDKERAMIEAEMRAGLRCMKCRRRLETTVAPSGFEFVRFEHVMTPKGPAVQKITIVTCLGQNGCTGIHEAAANAVAVREIAWKFLRSDGGERAELKPEPVEPDPEGVPPLTGAGV